MCRPDFHGDHARLGQVRDRLTAGDLSVLETTDNHAGLVRGFVSCNLVMDVVDSCWNLLSRDSANVTREVTWGQMERWLDAHLPPNRPGPENAADLTGDGAAYDVRENDPDHPWRRIHLWLLIEALLRLLSHDERRETVWQHAKKTFEEILQRDVASLGVDPSALCTTRSPSALTAFREWWVLCVPLLSRGLRNVCAIRDELGAGEDDNGRERAVKRRLTGLLVPDLIGVLPALTKLLAEKHNQLRMCVARLNDGVQYPLPRGWLGDFQRRLVSALAVARAAGRDFILKSDDPPNLAQLLQWVEANGLHAGTRLGPPNDLQVTAVWNAAHHATPRTFVSWLRLAPAPRVPANQVEQFASEWDVLARIVRTRGLPSNWRVIWPVADLFFCPLPLNLGAWYQRTEDYWEPL